MSLTIESPAEATPRPVRRREPKALYAERYDAILDAVQQGEPIKGIAARLGVPLHVVDHAIHRGRATGDPRALARPRYARAGAQAQNNAILDAWQKGETTAAISRALDVTAEHVSYVVCKARRAGDPRAVRRKPGQQAKVPAP